MPRKRILVNKNYINISDVGRLGNCIFRYIKAISICLEKDNFEYLNSYEKKGIQIYENNLDLLKSKNNFFTLNSFFQHEITEENKKKIKEYINNHPEHYLITDGGKGYHYESEKYFVKDLIDTPENFDKYYDLVLHIRLEDFVKLNNYIDCKFICKVLDMVKENDKINTKNVAIVCNKITTDFEKEYIKEISDYYKKIFGEEINLESNNVVQDFHIIKNAQIVVSSTSTICWSACLFSEKLKKCYFPNWNRTMRGFKHDSVSFRKPLENTILYDIIDKDKRIKYSLCIPTMNRYDSYLSKNLPKYIENDLIEEIIIQDENGNDIDKIKNSGLDLSKIKLYKNESVLGPFLNKIKVCKKAKNEWIALIDSDNFADEDYFLTMTNSLTSYKMKKTTILSPDYASEIFQWKYLSETDNNKINKQTFKKLKIIDNEYTSKNSNVGCIHHLLNLGNFVINKYLIENIDLKDNFDIISNSHSFDVCLFLYICFTQFNLDFILVKDCKYTHTSSEDSIYLRYNKENQKYAEETYNNIYKFLN